MRTMPKARRFLFLSLAAVVIGLAVGVWLVWPQPTMITAANADRISRGMLRQEVELILGGAPREERAGVPLPPRPLHGGPYYVCEWVSDEAHILVYFDPDGRMVGHNCGAPGLADREPLMRRLCRWLGL